MKKLMLLLIIALLSIAAVQAFYQGTGYQSKRFFYHYPVCKEYYLEHAPFSCPKNSEPTIVVCTYRELVIHSRVGCVVG